MGVLTLNNPKMIKKYVIIGKSLILTVELYIWAVHRNVNHKTF